MLGPENQALIAAGPEATVRFPVTIRLSFFLNENGFLRRIWSLTATMMWPSGIGDSNANRRVAFPGTGAGAGPCCTGATATRPVAGGGEGNGAFFLASCCSLVL